jgi:2-polyprenyl-6-methoxyphenol hydroxylase-like FAD-dependent oxidoreductase
MKVERTASESSPGTWGGHPLLTNRSTWINFRVVSNRRWSFGHLVLIGDALRTVHFSVGSGTRMALQDAVVLARALAETDDVERGLQLFEQLRRPQVEEFLKVAGESFEWYEHFRERLSLEPVPFAYDYVMRGGHIGHARLRERSPRLADAYDAYKRKLENP